MDLKDVVLCLFLKYIKIFKLWDGNWRWGDGDYKWGWNEYVFNCMVV